MKKCSSLIIVSLLFVLAGCNYPSGAQATPTPVDAVVQFFQQQMALQLTKQVVDAAQIEIDARKTATQQVLDMTATEQARLERISGTSTSSASTQQAWNVTVEAAKTQDVATQQAQQTGTAQALVGMTATISVVQTATAEKKTQEAPIIAARNKEVQAQADSVALAADRERMMNGVIAWGPWVVVAVVLGAVIYFSRKYFQVRIFKPDERGDAPYLLVDGTQIIDLDNMPGALLNLKTQQSPLLTSEENAANIKARDQFVDLNTRGLPYQFQERKPTGQMPMPGASSKVELAPYSDVQKLLGAAEDQLSDEEVG